MLSVRVTRFTAFPALPSMDYIVKTSDLLKVAKELVEEGMDYVEISLSEPDEELPAMVSFCATEAGELDGWTDFDDLEVVNPWAEKA